MAENGGIMWQMWHHHLFGKVPLCFMVWRHKGKGKGVSNPRFIEKFPGNNYYFQRSHSAKQRIRDFQVENMGPIYFRERALFLKSRILFRGKNPNPKIPRNPGIPVTPSKCRHIGYLANVHTPVHTYRMALILKKREIAPWCENTR